jgi:hypothetical protein
MRKIWMVDNVVCVTQTKEGGKWFMYDKTRGVGGK